MRPSAIGLRERFDPRCHISVRHHKVCRHVLLSVHRDGRRIHGPAEIASPAAKSVSVVWVCRHCDNVNLVINASGRIHRYRTTGPARCQRVHVIAIRYSLATQVGVFLQNRRVSKLPIGSDRQVSKRIPMVLKPVPLPGSLQQPSGYQ